MSTLVGQREWRLLANVIDGLPQHSHYGEAVAMDRSLVDPNAKPVQPRPAMREWTPIVELLAAMYGRMNDFVQTQATKDLKLKPWPTPITAHDLVRAEERKRRRALMERRIAEAQQRYREQHGDN